MRKSYTEGKKKNSVQLCKVWRDSYLKEADDSHLVVGDQRLRLGDLVQGGDGGPGPLLQPVDYVICLPAGCDSKNENVPQTLADTN